MYRVYANRLAISKMMANRRKPMNLSQNREQGTNSFLEDRNHLFNVNKRTKLYKKKMNNYISFEKNRLDPK